jgi:hypothetical protein
MLITQVAMAVNELVKLVTGGKMVEKLKYLEMPQLVLPLPGVLVTVPFCAVEAGACDVVEVMQLLPHHDL